MAKPRTSNLEFISSVGIESSVVVEDVDEREVMTDSNLVVVSVMCRGNLDSSGTKLHVNNDRVRDDWDSAMNERVDGVFSVKMLRLVQTGNTKRGFAGTHGIPGVIRVNCDRGISKHSFGPGGGNGDLFVCEAYERGISTF